MLFLIVSRSVCPRYEGRQLTHVETSARLAKRKVICYWKLGRNAVDTFENRPDSLALIVIIVEVVFLKK